MEILKLLLTQLRGTLSSRRKILTTIQKEYTKLKSQEAQEMFQILLSLAWNLQSTVISHRVLFHQLSLTRSTRSQRVLWHTKSQPTKFSQLLVVLSTRSKFRRQAQILQSISILVQMWGWSRFITIWICRFWQGPIPKTMKSQWLGKSVSQQLLLHLHWRSRILAWTPT